MILANEPSKCAAQLRFGALIRVSTEQQERQGESLRTQEIQIEEAVGKLDGIITRRYAGQEHATVGWERQQLAQLLADAALSPRPFDAVMVAHPDRWSRDNVRSENGLEALQQRGIRFFILTQEQDLYDPTVRLFLALSATIGSYQASLQAKKSLENRIERAKRGWPTCGKVPFGRTFDRETGKWGVDTKTQSMVRDVASRYLAGESMARLAEEYGINHSHLHKALTRDCGSHWEQHFTSAKLNINVAIPTIIPPLLDDEIIASVRRRAAANRTYTHGHLKYRYLFARVVFCDVCGYAMSGQTIRHGWRCYRHPCRSGAKDCGLNSRPAVPADLLETTVLAHLADFWGNPKAVEKALAAAEPNRAEMEQTRKRLGHIEVELGKIRSGRERLLSFIAKGSISDSQAERQLVVLNDRELGLSTEADSLRQRLVGTLSAGDRRLLAGRVSAKRRLLMRNAQDPENMTWEQKRILVEDVFGGLTRDGRRMGIYVKPIGVGIHRRNRRWAYEIRGRIELGGILPETPATNSASYSPTPILL